MTKALDSVVVNYQTPRDLEDFLASYNTHPPFWQGGLTVVNVAPTDRDRDVVAGWLGKFDFSVIEFADNVGYARACNRGAMEGEGDMLALFNADVVVTPDSLTFCYEALAAEPTWGVLGPRQVNEHNQLVGCGIFGDPRRPVQAAWMQTDRGQCGAIREDALTVSGSAYFVRRDVWQGLADCPLYRRAAPDAEGAFLPTPHYYEETWCSYHARAHGLKAVFYGPVSMVHKWHRASPLGGPADQRMTEARTIYQRACRMHRIVCE